MGNQVSTNSFDTAHLRIYNNILHIKSPGTRVQMIQTLLAGPEYVASMKRAGVYANLLAYVSSVQRGERPALLPGERTGVVVQEQSAQNTSSRDTVSNQVVMRGGGATIVDPYKRVAKPGAHEKAM